MVITEKDLHVEKIRTNIPSLRDIVFFNSGWSGPTPKAVLDAVNKSLEYQVQVGPSTKESLRAHISELGETKLKVAKYFFCEKENICLTPNTTLGINVALNAYNWGQNDEIVTTKNEHASVLIPLYNLKERYGTKIKLIDIDVNNPLKSFRESISKDTKAVVFSHVFWTTGLVLPVKEIVKEIKEHKIISIIDGAQAAGNLKVDLSDIDPDFYSAPGHKWLLGPHGTGFLYVSKRLMGKRPPWPSIVGYESAGDASDDSQYDLNFKWNSKKDAGVFEFGGLNCSLFYGLAKALDIGINLSNEFDIYNRIHNSARYLIERLKENSNITIITSNPHCGLVSWQHKKINSSELVSNLWSKKRILIREISNFNFCRASVHFFNTREEIDLLVESINGL